jgi:hypothetical protein
VGQSRLGGASCRSSHVRNAPLATVGPKKAACRDGPTRDNRLLDHLVGLYEKRLRQAKAESFCGFQVDYHFESGRQLNWKFVCLRSPEYAVDVGCRPTKQIAPVNAVGKQAAAGDKGAKGVDRR